MKDKQVIEEAPNFMNYLSNAAGRTVGEEPTSADKNKQKSALTRAKSATGSDTSVAITQKGLDTAVAGKAGTQMDRDAEAEVVQQHLDLLNPDYKLQSMYINLLKQLKQKKDSAGRMPGGDLNTPTYQRQGKTRGDMGIPGEYKSDGGRVPTADEIASGKIQMNSAENNAEPIQEKTSVLSQVINHILIQPLV